ncbi:hypothetical protein D7Y44_10145 [Stenotrophomonas maltophilia]|uniref:hypothetical protein n=1 Tax=Stenotrophomonas maltophilia TaxID=40324 RepID=UPI0015DD7EAF|nr:hypothetical protein [Stenotrophomonas maltophilia]MBA0280961.1 hypothetical protein [Stenotrophomonas maltophilia]MBA0344695.1 hypothetical protein [Stenotrophomonas maltophilia]MBA0357797.1 hypothetical protein [Stenotrophomonas maltophilia]MBA0519827.1 hypothetical protein [Stenotrophomonas maltophilia]
MDDAALLLALDSREYLFLTDIGEPEANCLRLVIEEGQVKGEPRPVDLGNGRSIEGVRAIEITSHSQRFKLVWNAYISYAVHNESYQSWDDSEAWSGNLFRRYSRSKFLDYLERATFADTRYPGPFMHYQVICQDHVIDIAALQPPRARLLGPS